MIFFETDRLILRNFVSSDLEELYDYRNNEACRRYQRGQLHTGEDLRALLFAHCRDALDSPGQKCLAIAFKDSGRLLGDVFVSIVPPTISLGYTLSYKYHRQGYGYELLSALTSWLHTQYPACEVVCCVEPENAASIALLHKLGFANEGYAEKISSLIFSKWAAPPPDA